MSCLLQFTNFQHLQIPVNPLDLTHDCCKQLQSVIQQSSTLPHDGIITLSLCVSLPPSLLNGKVKMAKPSNHITVYPGTFKC